MSKITTQNMSEPVEYCITCIRVEQSVEHRLSCKTILYVYNAHVFLHDLSEREDILTHLLHFIILCCTKYPSDGVVLANCYI